MKRKYLFLLMLSSLVLPASAADVYKWTDANGRTHVSDRAPAGTGAERMRIRIVESTGDFNSSDAPQAAPRVVMLSTTWCGVCRRARNWFQQNGVAFTEYDVEHNETGKAEFRRLAGRGVPIILVGDKRMDGFSPTRMKSMLQPAE